MRNFKFAILKNETEEDHLGWIRACENSKYEIKYKIIDITKSDWLVNVLKEDFDCFLTRPPGAISYFKQLYDERLYIIHKVLSKKIYPIYEEILIYENKRMLAYWLEANRIPHPDTWIFYEIKDAIKFAENCNLPIVAKTAIGAGGSGVLIFKKKANLIKYIDIAFSNKGIGRNWGPNLRKGDILNRLIKRLLNIKRTVKYFKRKHNSATIDPQKWYVIFQEYITCNFEWRCVRIGDSFFAHKKLRTYGEMISGTSKVSWDKPSVKLLNFIKDITDKRAYLSQAVDIFEDKNSDYLVNELQCFWGSKNPHQMIIDGIPGRYKKIDNNWVFEEGTFNKNNSYNLRIEHIIFLLKHNLL